MRAVVQRVHQASVSVDGNIVGSINRGILLFLGIHRDDDDSALAWMVNKVLHLRIFEDDRNKMNRSLVDICGEILIVSQFTLYGDCRKGRRPGFSEAAPSEKGVRMYEQFVAAVTEQGITAATGTFQAMMDVALVNDGPVTLLLDSAKTF